ncbi:MAG: TonB-dependent receptor plug domain-containing protein [Desulfobacteraceae bacterium]|jgi:iron complex outermembrane receptor protein
MKWKWEFCFVLIITSLFIMSGLVSADEKEEEESVKLEKIVVTASDEEAITISPTTTTINVDKYVAAGNVQTVQDLLGGVPGVEIQRSSVGASAHETVLLRGFDTEEFLVTIDGRPITGVSGSLNLPVDWSSLSLDGVEKIEVKKGASSAVYGDTFGGVINIVMKKGVKTETLKPKFGVEGEIAEYDTQNFRINISGGAGSFLYSLSGGYRHSDGYLRNNYTDSNDSNIRLTYLTPTGGSLNIGWKRNDVEIGYPLANDLDDPLSQYDPSYPIVRGDADIGRQTGNSVCYIGGDSYFKRKTNYWDINFNQPTTKWGTFNAQFYADRGDPHDYQYAYSYDKGTKTWVMEQSVREGDRVNTRTWGGKFSHEFKPAKDHNLIWGLEYSNLGQTARPTWIVTTSAYIQDAWDITQKLNLTLGFRYAHQTVEFNEDTYIYREPQPKSILTYKFTPKTSGYISIGRAFSGLAC